MPGTCFHSSFDLFQLATDRLTVSHEVCISPLRTAVSICLPPSLPHG